MAGRPAGTIDRRVPSADARDEPTWAREFARPVATAAANAVAAVAPPVPAAHGGTVSYVEGFSPAPTASGPFDPASPAPSESMHDDFRSSLVRGYFAEAPGLHALPTMYVVGASMLAVTMLTGFLQTTVIPSTGHFAVFGFGSFTCFSSYYMAAHFLGEHARSFQRISPDKKLYTVSNLIKAGVLAAITPLGVVALRDALLYDTWDTNTLRNLGCIYAIPDFVSLIVVRRMSTSTIIHHLCVVVFNFLSLYNDYAKENVFRLVAVYGAFSTFGYIVYMLLASRFLGVAPPVARALSLVALVTYVGCCGVNWLWQVTYLRHLYRNHHHWTIYVYATVIWLVVFDDVQLCRWLLRRAREHTRSPSASSHAIRGPAARTAPLPVGGATG